jgi:tetratricopeptide (TPR) repeat protein
LEDVFAMQERVSSSIVNSLRVTISPEEEKRLEERPIADLRAYECYLQARHALWTFTVSSLDRAQQFLHNAVRIIGDNPRLLAALGGVHLSYADTGAPGLEQHLADADDCARRLGLLEPDSAALRWLRGMVQFRRGEIRESIASFERAASLDPNGADVHGMLTYMYCLAGRDEEARRAAETTVALDPLTPLFQCFPGTCQYFLGNFRAALPHYRRFLAMDPANPAAHFFLAWMLTMAGERDDAIDVGARLVQAFPGTIFAQFATVFIHALRNDPRAGLLAITPELRSTSKQGEMFGRILADACAMLGDPDGAIDALWDAQRLGFSHYPFLAVRAPLLSSLRSRPRFAELLAVVRLHWERGGA